MGAESDLEVVRRTLEGDRRAFEKLILRHGRMAYAVAFAQLGSHHDAEDAVQESWIQAFTSLHRLHDASRFAPWLASIVRNTSINAARNRWRKRELDESRDFPMTDPRSAIEDADVRRALWAHIEAMPPDQREVLTLYYHAGLGVDELSTLIGVPRETVKKRLQRARMALSAQTLQTLFEPAERDEEKRRKRVMAMVLLLPLPERGEHSPQPQRLPRPFWLTGIREAASNARGLISLSAALATAAALAWGAHSCQASRQSRPDTAFQAPVTSPQRQAPPYAGAIKGAPPVTKGGKG